MHQEGPKRRSTQLGIGESGLHPRAADGPPAVAPPADGPAPAVQCPSPSPSSPPRRTASGEHGTVEFSGEPVRTRAASVPDEVTERARDEAARSDSVRARMIAGRETQPAMARAASTPAPGSVSGRHRGDPARDPREETDALRGREERIDVVSTARPEKRTSGPPETVRAPAARPGSAPPRRPTDQHIRSARETIKNVTTWDIEEPAAAAGRVGRPASSPPESSRQPPSGSGRAAVRIDDVGANAVRLAARAAGDPTPKVLVQRRALASAPIDHREAFLVSLIDGSLTVSGLVDVSGMPAGEVASALQRLARLGIVSL